MTPALLVDHGIEERKSGQLSYLERKADSDKVTVFFHGLGLDATDYLGYLRQHDRHCVALNLRGYEPGGASVPLVPLARHIQMTSAFLEQIARRNPGKSLVLVGFSLGADLILQVAEQWAERGDDAPPVAAALLLDPNVNQSTMTISRLFATADPRDPVPVFKQLINLAPGRDEFRSLCSYLAKIALKDFDQVRQLSQDMVNYWDKTGYEQFGTRLNHVTHIAERVHLVLSAAYQEHLPFVRAAVMRSDGADTASVRLMEVDHFDLIGDGVLPPALDALT